jgi:hypothetical protein
MVSVFVTQKQCFHFIADRGDAVYIEARQLMVPMWRGLAFKANLAAVFLILFAIEACAAQNSPSNPMTIPVVTILKGNFSGIHQPLQVTVRDQKEWEALWKRHTSNQSPPSPLPAVDFTTEMVVGLFAGDKTTGGYEVEISRAELKGSDLYIFYLERNPAPGGMAIQAITQPFHLVKLAKHDGPLEFVKLAP